LKAVSRQKTLTFLGVGERSVWDAIPPCGRRRDNAQVGASWRHGADTRMES